MLSPKSSKCSLKSTIKEPYQYRFMIYNLLILGQFIIMIMAAIITLQVKSKSKYLASEIAYLESSFEWQYAKLNTYYTQFAMLSSFAVLNQLARNHLPHFYGYETINSKHFRSLVKLDEILPAGRYQALAEARKY